MKIYMGADHRGFELKGKLLEWMKGPASFGVEVQDCGSFTYDKDDDYPLIVHAVVEKMQAEGLEQSRGIVICGSGVGVDIAANRHKGIRCGLGFDIDQVRHARDHEDINMLALASDEITFGLACELITVFLATEALSEPRMMRREEELDNL